MSAKINGKSVFDSTEDHPEFKTGTPIILIGSTHFDIKMISAAMLETDEERGFAASVCLKAMQFLASYTSKVAVKEEATAKRQEAEEKRLKEQAEHIDPLLSGLSPILSELAVCDPRLIKAARIWVSFTEKEISLSFPIVGPSEDSSLFSADELGRIAEGLNARGIGLKTSDTETEGIVFTPSVKKATGTRAKGTAVLIDGLHRLNEGKALEGFTGGFVVHNGRIHVQGAEGRGFVYESGKDFLSDYTTEEGSRENPDRPWGFPSKIIASVSSFVGEDTEMYKAYLQWNETKVVKTDKPEIEAQEADGANGPSDGEKGLEEAENAPSNERGSDETPETEETEEPF